MLIVLILACTMTGTVPDSNDTGVVYDTAVHDSGDSADIDSGHDTADIDTGFDTADTASDTSDSAIDTADTADTGDTATNTCIAHIADSLCADGSAELGCETFSRDDIAFCGVPDHNDGVPWWDPNSSTWSADLCGTKAHLCGISEFQERNDVCMSTQSFVAAITSPKDGLDNCVVEDDGIIGSLATGAADWSCASDDALLGTFPSTMTCETGSDWLVNDESHDPVVSMSMYYISAHKADVAGLFGSLCCPN